MGGRIAPNSSDKSAFRNDLTPERNEGLDVGVVGRRFRFGRFKEAIADIGTFLSATLASPLGAASGGTGLDASASTGTLHFEAGTPTIGSPILESYAHASLPAAGTVGRLARVTDKIRGIWMDTGTVWRSVSGVANVLDFGASSSLSDNISAFNAAMAAAAAMGVPTFLPAEAAGGSTWYKVKSPVQIPDGTGLITGFGQSTYGGAGAGILENTGFTGDALVMAASRDDNNPNKWDKVFVRGIALYPYTGITALDLTGFHDSEFVDIYILGYNGGAVSGSVALRMSDANPANTSHKSTFYNRVQGIRLGWGAGTETAIQIESRYGDMSINSVSNFEARCKYGIKVGAGGYTGSAANRFTVGYLLDTGLGGGVDIPSSLNSYNGLVIDTVATENFATTNLPAVGGPSIRSNAMVVDIFNLSTYGPYLNYAGTTPSAPISLPGSFSTPFQQAGYVKFPSGTVLAAGVNTLNATANYPPTAGSQVLTVTPISGAPAIPLSYFATWDNTGSYIIAVSVISPAALTLTADLVLFLQVTSMQYTGSPITPTTPGPGAGSAIYDAGGYRAVGANGQHLDVAQLTELKTITSGASCDTTIQMPANSVVLSVNVRTTETITSAGAITHYQVGDAGSATRFSTANVSVTAPSTDPGTAAGAYYNATAASIRLTAVGANFNGVAGKVRVTIVYYSVTPPTS